ncbi:MAG: isochorismatase family protein [bacterium]
MLYSKMNPKNTALLVIDIINSCADKKCEIPKYGITFSKIRKIVPKLEKFIDNYRKIVSGLVIFTNTVPWQKKYLADNINKLYTDSRVRYYSKDNSGFSEKFYTILPKKGDVIITKNTIDAFTNKKFESVLKKNKIRYMVITGIFGDGCVLATICGGFSNGYNFIILKDLIETTDVKIRQKLLNFLKEYTWPIMYGQTVESKDFLISWRKKH